MTNMACCCFHGGGPVNFFWGGDGGTANLCPAIPTRFGFGLLGFSAVSPAAVPLPDAQVFLLTPFSSMDKVFKVE